MSNQQPIRPTAMQVTELESNFVLLEFDTDEIPPICLSAKGAKQTGSRLQNAGHMAGHRTGDSDE